jgi:small subunit ribosomal protein S2
MVDTCCDPTPIDYVIPANDDATKSIELIMNILCKAIEEGLSERKLEKEKEATEETAEGEALVNPTGKKLRARKNAKPVDVEAEAAAPAPAPEAAPEPAPAPEETPVEEAPKAE